jgi:colicin import membrane protein
MAARNSADRTGGSDEGGFQEPFAIMKQLALIALVIVGLIGLSGCGEKPPAAELKAAQDAVAAAKAANVDPGNADLTKATESLAKAQAEIDAQGKKTFGGNYASAKTMLANAKSLSEKAVADKKAADEVKAKAEAEAKAKAEAEAKAKAEAAAKKKGGAAAKPTAAAPPAAAPAGAAPAAPAAKKAAKKPDAKSQMEAAQKKVQETKKQVDTAVKK